VNAIIAKLLCVALATTLVVGGGIVVADLVLADDPGDISAIEVRKDDAGADAELVDDDEGEGDRDDTRGDRDDTRSDETRGGGDTRSDHTAIPGAAPPPGPAPAPAHSDEGGGHSDG
jgi:hypothetical protein